MWKPFKALKIFLPRTLFGRSLLILLTPLVLVQIITTTVFYDRHWTWVTRHLGNRIAQEFVTVIEDYANNPTKGIATAKRFQIEPQLSKKKPLIKLRANGVVRKYMHRNLRKSLDRPFQLGVRKNFIYLITPHQSEWLILRTPRKYLSPIATPVFLLWAFFTPLLFFLAAAIFMRNHVRPMRRLADAAYHFGRGDHSFNFRPEGAEEVKRAGVAFQVMQQRIQRQMSMRTEMLASVSHDLRTPLTRMELAITLMDPSTQTEGIMKDIKEMTNLVNAYLAFAKGQEDSEPVDTVNLTDLIIETAASVSIEQITQDINIPAQTMFRCRRGLLLRGLRNILENALRYGTHAWIHTYTSKDYIYISVEDNGPGIPAEARLDVFKPFFRLEESRNPQTGGTGLGLSITKDAIVRHGGRISLSDSRHGGLGVNIKLPR
ncbi:MAG: HAMP domain-containing protein [Alphaproteobacteria bacterium]|nr:MAG: HAMP domain-containing protein [Alphaproteobacteria bacterium]